MSDRLTTSQRAGTAVFLGLCMLCLALSVWRGSDRSSTYDNTEAEAALIRHLNALQTAPQDSVEAPKQPRNHKPRKTRHSPDKRQPKPSKSPQLPRNPLNEPLPPI